MTDDVKRETANGANTDVIRDLALKNGMLDLKHYAMFLMAQGLTSVEEVLTNLVVSN
jgi:type II secretory ATPase GspE/PulE/Tfp pilus assembly ATPase PilB-like protein